MTKILTPFLLLSIGTGFSCGSEPTGATQSAVVTTIGFAARNGDMVGETEVSDGIDLDGRTSDRTDTESCRRSDFVSPDGRGGIDNQFTYLFETVEDMAEEGTVEGIIQGSINGGRLLLMIEVNDVEDWNNDDSVSVRVFNAVGTPNLASDGYLVPDQTFDIDPESPVNEGTGRIVDGVLETDPFEVELPMAFFNVFFDLTLVNAQIRADIGPEGVSNGVMGGAVTIDQILEIAAMADEMQEVQYGGLLMGVLPGMADMQRVDGRCTALSANLFFESRRAFLFPEPAPDTE